jgi:signal transduction histidine kinase
MYAHWVSSPLLGVFTHRLSDFTCISPICSRRPVTFAESSAMHKTDIQLRERVKELKCLYELSRIAWEADNDLTAIVNKALTILPPAMQYPEAAEVSITIDGSVSSTAGFKQSVETIASPLMGGNKKRGEVVVGYRKTKGGDHLFLREERRLIKAVAREFSLILKRIESEEEKQKLQMQLQHVERLAFVGELSAGIAHELNEPLGRILGFAQLIKKTGGLSDQQSEDIERIVKASLYTREIIKKLMIFSRQMPRQITWLNLNDIVSNILYFIDVRFVGRQVTIIQRLDGSLAPIQADEVQISQVLVNLITNAIHAMPRGGELIIATKNKGDGVSLSVQDTGHGMTPDVRKKIFEPFFTTKPVGQGTGLGLSVVQGIIVAHGGKIQVSSQPGKGTRGARFPLATSRTNACLWP